MSEREDDRTVADVRGMLATMGELRTQAARVHAAAAFHQGENRKLAARVEALEGALWEIEASDAYTPVVSIARAALAGETVP